MDDACCFRSGADSHAEQQLYDRAKPRRIASAAEKDELRRMQDELADQAWQEAAVLLLPPQLARFVQLVRQMLIRQRGVTQVLLRDLAKLIELNTEDYDAQIN